MKGGIAFPQGYSPSIDLPGGSPSQAALAINANTQVVKGADSKGGAKGGFKGGAATFAVTNVQTSSYPTNYPADATSSKLMQIQTQQLVNSQEDSAAINSKGGRTKRRYRRRKQKQRTTKRRYRKRSRKYRR